MNIQNLEWCYGDKKRMTHISFADKSTSYFLDKDCKVPLIYCSGEVVKPYFRKVANISDVVLASVFGNSESIEHYNCKMRFKNNLGFSYMSEDGSFWLDILCFSAQEEYHIKEIKKTVDVMYFSEDGFPILGIEVYHTNKKKKDDIDKFNKLNFPIYEYDISTETGKFISINRDKSEEERLLEEEIECYKGKLRVCGERIEAGRRHLEVQQHSYNQVREGFEESEKQSKLAAEIYYENNYQVEYIEEFFSSIQSEESTRKRVEEVLRDDVANGEVDMLNRLNRDINNFKF